MLVQLLAGADPALRAHEILKEAQFPRTQFKAGAAPAHLPLEQVQRKVGDLEFGRIERHAPPGQGAHPGNNLRKYERLRQVVVRPDVETPNAVLHLAARGQEQDGRGAVRASQFTQDFQPVAPWKHDVQNERIERLVEGKPEAGFAIGCDHDLSPGPDKRFLDGIGDLSLVFHDEDTHGRHAAAWDGFRQPAHLSAGNSNTSVSAAGWRRPPPSLTVTPDRK